MKANVYSGGAREKCYLVQSIKWIFSRVVCYLTKAKPHGLWKIFKNYLALIVSTFQLISVSSFNMFIEDRIWESSLISFIWHLVGQKTFIHLFSKYLRTVPTVPGLCEYLERPGLRSQSHRKKRIKQLSIQMTRQPTLLHVSSA